VAGAAKLPRPSLRTPNEGQLKQNQQAIQVAIGDKLLHGLARVQLRAKDTFHSRTSEWLFASIQGCGTAIIARKISAETGLGAMPQSVNDNKKGPWP